MTKTTDTTPHNTTSIALGERNPEKLWDLAGNGTQDLLIANQVLLSLNHWMPMADDVIYRYGDIEKFVCKWFVLNFPWPLDANNSTHLDDTYRW